MASTKSKYLLTTKRWVEYFAIIFISCNNSKPLSSYGLWFVESTKKGFWGCAQCWIISLPLQLFYICKGLWDPPAKEEVLVPYVLSVVIKSFPWGRGKSFISLCGKALVLRTDWEKGEGGSEHFISHYRQTSCIWLDNRVLTGINEEGKGNGLFPLSAISILPSTKR